MTVVQWKKLQVGHINTYQ